MRDPVFLESADRIGARLCRDAIWSGQQCNWLGWALEVVGNSWTPVYRAQSSKLYDGTSGIALFLARLYGFTQDAMQKRAALGALNQAMAGINSIPEMLRPSLYSGNSGVAFAAIELGIALSDSQMIQRGVKELETATAVIRQGWLDIISGSAGAIQVLLQVARRHSAPQLVDIALRHGDGLLKAACRSDRGWSWDTLPGQTERHLLGYGHGAGGIGCALLELWTETGEDKYRHAAIESFRYERAQFDPEAQNWPDLRNLQSFVPAGTGPVFALAWCHGAPGIGLVRLRAMEWLDDGEVCKDLNRALQLTSAACSNVSFPASGSLCLCHGLGGNADLMLLAADVQGRPEFRQIAEDVGRRAINDIQMEDSPWPCGVNGAGETPNLMLGVAGIGHFFLRLYDSTAIPSILLLRPESVRAQMQATLSPLLGEAVGA